MKKWSQKIFYARGGRVLLLLVNAGLLTTSSFAQTSTGTSTTANGNNGIQEANNLVRGYFADGTNLMYGVGAVLGLIGAVKVYSKWSHGDPDTGKTAAAWFGSCIFLVIVATVIKQFFGIS
ncbi:MAG: DUF4134 domain-containing protein [Puia sp.]|nr:DUF4134 domain-containing protein [Puia sp.]